MTFMPKTETARRWFAEFGQTLSDLPTFDHMRRVVLTEIGDVQRFHDDLVRFGLHREAEQAQADLHAAATLAQDILDRIATLRAR